VIEGKKGETKRSGAGGRSGKSGWRRGDKEVQWMNLWSKEETEWGDEEEAS
jgi:hypothetical protein